MNNVDALLRNQLDDLKLLEDKCLALLPLFKKSTENIFLKGSIERIEKVAYEHRGVLAELIDDASVNDTVQHQSVSITSLIADVRLYLDSSSDEKNDPGLIANLQRILSSKTSLLISAHRFARELKHTKFYTQLQMILNETHEENELLDRLAEDRLIKKEIKDL